VEFLVGDDALVAGFAFEDDGGFILAGGFGVALDAIVGDVELAAGEPLDEGRLPVERLVEGFEPVEFGLG